jgi:glucosamine-phosphate N-acetyltransferase
LGLGKKIIERLVDIAKKRGCYKIVLNSLNHNKSFYLSCGFSESGVQFVSRM